MTYNRNLCYYENGEFMPYEFNESIQKATSQYYVGNTITKFAITDQNEITLWLVTNLGYPIEEIKISNSGIIKKISKPIISAELIRAQKSITHLELFENVSKLVNDNFFTDKLVLQTEKFGRVHVYNWDTVCVIGTKTGVYFYSKVEQCILRKLLEKFYVTSITKDFEGGYWCSSLYNGVFYIPNPKIFLFKIAADFNNGHINGILETEQTLLFCFNTRNNNYRINSTYSLLLNDTIPLSFQDLKKECLNRGLKLENSLCFEEFFPEVTSIVKFSHSKYLIASPTRGIIKVYKNFKKIPLNVSDLSTDYDFYENTWYVDREIRNWYKTLPSQEYWRNERILKFPPKVLKLFKDSKKNIWLGTLTGLFEFDRNKEIPLKSSLFSEIESFRIQDIEESNNGSLFFATKSNGIYVYYQDKIKKIENYNIDKLNAVYQMEYDSIKNEFLIASNSGVYILVRKDSNWVYQNVISAFDGLELPDIRQIKSHKGYLFFANNMGVGKVKKSELSKRLPPPYLYFNSYAGGHSNFDLNDEINLPPNLNTLTVNYQAISYKSQNNFIYNYRLLPANSSWSSTTNSSIVFNSLDPGTYTLEVKAKNIDGVESEVKSVLINIEPNILQTWWFQFLIVLILIVTTSLIIRYVIRFYVNKTKLERKINEMQVLALQSKMSPHFIFNSLNSIQNYILKNDKEAANEYLLDFSRLIRTILQNSESTSIFLARELEILGMYVDLERKRLRSNFEYIVEIDEAIKIEECVIPSLLLQPYVENSIWHGKVYTNPIGVIKISIHKVNETLNFEIVDNGIGIQNASATRIIQTVNMHKSVGSDITKKRIKLLSELNNQMSKVTITEAFPNQKSNTFVGTIVKFSIPYELRK